MFDFPGFTGIDQQYEAPTSPEIVLKAGELSVDECVQQVVEMLLSKVRSFDFDESQVTVACRDAGTKKRQGGQKISKRHIAIMLN